MGSIEKGMFRVIETLTDLRGFWIPIAVLFLCGYSIWAYGQFRRRTTMRYIALYRMPMDRMRIIGAAVPRNDGSGADAEYKQYFWNEMKILGIKWALIVVAIYALTSTF